MLANEALGLSYRETLDSSYALIEVMMQEYAYITRERSKALDKGEDDEGGEYEWVELPSFDTLMRWLGTRNIEMSEIK